MAEQEPRIDNDALGEAIRLAAKEPHGLRIQLHPDEELRLVLGGSGGEITLFVAAKSQTEMHSSTLPPALAQSERLERSEADKRVRLRGRVGTEPQYKPLPRRGMRVGFRFAAFTETEKPDWHDVYATGRYAEAIRAKGISKGDEIEITGERQQAVQKQRGGSERTVERIFLYGASIKKRVQRPS